LGLNRARSGAVFSDFLLRFDASVDNNDAYMNKFRNSDFWEGMMCAAGMIIAAFYIAKEWIKSKLTSK